MIKKHYQISFSTAHIGGPRGHDTKTASLEQRHCWPATVHVNKTCQICYKLLLGILLYKSLTEQGLPEHLMQMYENEHVDVHTKAKKAYPSFFSANMSVV